ncbi:hypothetical protein [Ornithinimicrobium faecis]|uniref:hypothetical protein n=1 Tax=Ornithinimicrobium faecis TaxID=2934158 RepID=UPI002118E761|nr:hypothetical protein [Ornithinimicrobium sp. HY1745]
MSEKAISEALTLDEAFRAVFFMTDQYLAREREPDEGLVLFHQYLQSDPARWEDWEAAVRRALEVGATDPLVENLHRSE